MSIFSGLFSKAQPVTEATESAQVVLNRLITGHMQTLESNRLLRDALVDPREAYWEDGELWSPIGAGGSGPLDEPPFRNDGELDVIRAKARWLARSNEFAICGHQNRISYIVGQGHTYTAVGREQNTNKTVITKVQKWLDEWLKLNKWNARQQETQYRVDRDGEVFRRMFPHDDGFVRVRFVEPGNVRPPETGTVEEWESFGIRTAKDDVEEIEDYHVKGEDWVNSKKIQHYKANVDSGIKRGMPLFDPGFANLNRAAKLLVTMASAVEIQNAIALIRKHDKALKADVTSFTAANADLTVTQTTTGKQRHVRQYPPGSILDTPAGTSYDFPSQGLDTAKTVTALQALLRAAAALIGFPEFMLTADASNASYSSTMVAEGPAVKRFERDQGRMIEFDLATIDTALAFAVEAGLLTQSDLDQVKVQAEPPRVQTRDKLQEAQVRQIDMMLNILSPQTASGQTSLNYEDEQGQIEQHQERGGGPLTGDRPDLPGVPGDVDLDAGDISTVTGTAMSGIQITSLMGIVSQVAAGTLPVEGAKRLIAIAFPLLSQDQIDALLAAFLEKVQPSP